MPRQTESTITKLLTLADQLTPNELLTAIDILKYRYKHWPNRPDREASASRSESPKGRGRRRATSQTGQTDPAAVVGE